MKLCGQGIITASMGEYGFQRFDSVNFKYMKKLIIILSLFTMQANAGTLYDYIANDYIKDHWKQGALIMSSGAADGMMDALRFHYPEVKEVHPNINDQFWNPSKSWTNKYKNNDPSQGDAFFLSSSTLVPFTDGWHALKAYRNISITVALTIGQTTKDKKLWCYLVDIAYYTLCRAVGFYITYDLIY